ncbi:MAG TPA: lipopolysaccharide heptosyltransferase II [Candidatus Omnitrophota bacterium]|nr:lipopolysaccharide heptosyltransferase II [Candidatus Omnitrophota bacterium]HPN66345.1 lipopolysaccharide heptosyltransferase II [Candidatus Omnitrophota bacterium]HRZ66496.1 lipopolysaccharide heptosyltransferase II [Candidatus Omnitrophota bacterium]
MPENKRKYRILIIRTDRIGDVLLSTPAIKAVRDAYPNAHIAVMVRPYVEDVVDGNPYLDEVILYDKDNKQKGIFSTMAFIAGLRRKRFDLAIVLHPTVRSNVIPFLAGIPERVGYDRKWGFLLTKRLKDTKHHGEKHEIDYSLDVLRPVGITPKDRALYMPVKPEYERVIERFMDLADIGSKDIIVAISPGASCPSKRWPAYRFGRVADELAGRRGVKAVIIGGPSDKKTVDEVKTGMLHSPIVLSEEHSLGEVAALLKRCKLLISNDSGPVHIAVAVGTPVISIFGRLDPGLSPQRWGPVGPRDIVIHKDIGCEECLAHNCKLGFKCLEAVTVEDVLSAAEGLLGGG